MEATQPHHDPHPPPEPHIPSSSLESDTDMEIRRRQVVVKHNRKRLSKQLSMLETSREAAWEKRRRQILGLERRRNKSDYCEGRSSLDSVKEDITDEDLNELRGCIELGFGFNEEEGQALCDTLPALDLYFAVNRRLSPSPGSTPSASGSSLSRKSSSLYGSPRSDSDSWKICNPGN
ncbi:hypothetical protein Syun_012216 [Stephania yunnanensis]|uniref:Uncharacterized protein n=1 Tax=Stephania yunnanensis TaxID=152371 RepID=A0AAP0JZ86_9MAGN